MSARYALYFVPQPTTALAQFGARAIGHDIWTGQPAPLLDTETYRRHGAALTSEPRRYGFHATLKAPFHLASGHSEAELEARVAAFASKHSAVSLGHLHVTCLSHFIALVPRAPPCTLAALAADCVTQFDAFRAPLSVQDRARRLSANLSERQMQLLDAWGYPHVLDAFRFHMTLTGKVDDETRRILQEELAALYAMIDAPVVIDGLTLACQPTRDSPFHVKAHVPLRPLAAT